MLYTCMYYLLHFPFRKQAAQEVYTMSGSMTLWQPTPKASFLHQKSVKHNRVWS